MGDEGRKYSSVQSRPKKYFYVYYTAILRQLSDIHQVTFIFYEGALKNAKHDVIKNHHPELV